LLDIEAVWFRDNIPGVVDALSLNWMKDAKKEQSLSVLLSFNEVVLPTIVKTWVCEICGETVCTEAAAVLQL
jgi:hypothetical protein